MLIICRNSNVSLHLVKENVIIYFKMYYDCACTCMRNGSGEGDGVNMSKAHDTFEQVRHYATHCFVQ